MPPTRLHARALLLPVATLAAAVALAAASCRSTTNRRSAMDDVGAPTAPTRALRVFATGDTRGFLDPCGCEDGQFGGVPRRATYERRTHRPGDVWIDLGNLTSGDGEVRRLRTDASLDALALLSYDVLVPGASEIADGPAFEDAARARGLRVVCANLVDAEMRPVFDPFVVVDLPDGRRAAVVGIAEEVAILPPGRRMLPAAATLRQTVDDLRGKADVVIAATSLPLAAADRLAEVPGVAVVLSGSTPDPDRPFSTTLPAVVGVAGHLGEYVTRIDFGPDLSPDFTWRAWLDEQVPDDPDAAGIVRRYRDAVSAIDAGMVERLVDSHRAAGFAGSAACARCHRAEHDAWKTSLHARAMPTLVEKEAQRDPDCVPCHLVDVPAPTDTFDPDGMGVGCEACHGGSAAHCADPKVPTAAKDGGRGACASKCHHPPEVKSFSFAEKWPVIRHGGK